MILFAVTINILLTVWEVLIENAAKNNNNMCMMIDIIMFIFDNVMFFR